MVSIAITFRKRMGNGTAVFSRERFPISRTKALEVFGLGTECAGIRKIHLDPDPICVEFSKVPGLSGDRSAT